MSAAKHPVYKGRGLEGICLLAGLVGYEIDLDGIELLTPEQQRELEVWAERTHLRASDNPVRVPPRPLWLPGEPWQGAADQWGHGPTPVDCAAIAAAAVPRMNTEACKPQGEHANAPNVAFRKAYQGVRCMCVLTGCRAGPGCPHYCEHCKQHIAAVTRTAGGAS